MENEKQYSFDFESPHEEKPDVAAQEDSNSTPQKVAPKIEWSPDLAAKDAWEEQTGSHERPSEEESRAMRKLLGIKKRKY